MNRTCQFIIKASDNNNDHYNEFPWGNVMKTSTVNQHFLYVEYLTKFAEIPQIHA